MKIAILNTFYFPHQIGGAERSVQLLAENLVKRGHEVVIITSEKPHELQKHEVVNGVCIYRVPLKNSYWPFHEGSGRPVIWRRALWHYRDRFNPAMGRIVGEILKKEKPALLHTNNLFGFSVSVWSTAKSLSLPLIHTPHDFSLICPRNMYKNGRNCVKQCHICLAYSRIKRETSKLVDFVVGVSQFNLQKHAAFGYFPNARQTVIYNPVIQTNVPLTTADRETPKFKIGYLGQLTPIKGIEDLLLVLSKLRGELDADLVIAGRGEKFYEETLVEQAKTLPVTFLGFVPVESLFQQIDLLVVPSRCQEASPRVISEAYSYGIPVLGTRRGGIPELIEEGKTGWLYDPNSEEELKNILVKIGRARLQLKRMKPLLLRKARDFSLENFIERYSEVYHETTK